MVCTHVLLSPWLRAKKFPHGHSSPPHVDGDGSTHRLKLPGEILHNPACALNPIDGNELVSDGNIDPTLGGDNVERVAVRTFERANIPVVVRLKGVQSLSQSAASSNGYQAVKVAIISQA